jgi:glycosidase
LLTLEGAPILYYGTEVGLSQDGDAHQENAYARAPMRWGEQQDQELLAYYRQLIALRHAHPALRGPQRLTLPVHVLNTMPAAQRIDAVPAVQKRGAVAAAQEQVGAYLRWDEQEALLVVLNNAEVTVQLAVSLAGRAYCFTPVLLPAGGAWVEDGSPPVAAGGGQHITVTLPALSAAIFVAPLA